MLFARRCFCLLIVFSLLATSAFAACIEGDCFNGSGTVAFPDGRKYEGEFRDNAAYGQGTYTSPAQGIKYIGGFVNGIFSGQGTLSAPYGAKYEGEFKNGMFNGKGSFVSPKGTRYYGEFADDNYNGQGTLVYPDGTKYVGGFKDDLYNGHGTLNSSDGSKYTGSFRDGRYNGQGSLLSYDKSEYAGTFKGGKYNGQGTLKGRDGSKYTGTFRDGQYGGRGTLIYYNGTKYVGSFVDGMFSGQGTLTYYHGLKYTGGFKNGEYDGKGTIYYVSGKVGQGIWKKGRLFISTKEKTAREAGGAGGAEALSAPPDISVSVSFSEPSGNNILDADETGWIILTVRNSGKGDALELRAEIESGGDSTGLKYSRNLRLKTVPAGQTKRWKFKLSADRLLRAGQLSFTIKTLEKNGFDADPVRISFRTKAFEPPDLVIADMVLEDQNKNSRVEPLENVEITVRVQNMGRGDAKGVAVDVHNGKNVFIGGDNVRHFTIGNLEAGGYRDISFIFYTNKRIGDKEPIPLKLKITEQRPEFNVEKTLGLAMNASHRNIMEVMIRGSEGPGGDTRLSTGLGVDVERNLPKTRMRNTDAIAVVIGNRDYKNTKNVDYALNDAESIKMYLTDVLGYREGNIFYLANATKGDFDLLFGSKDNHKGKLFNAVKPGKSDVFIFYSGHGAPGLKNHKGYFVPVEADPNYVELSGYPLDVFYENLSRLPARGITVVLEACFSGAIFEGISPLVVQIDNPAVKLDNAVVLSSSSGSQVSSWYDEKKHGMFTYFFLKSMHDRKSDVDRDGNLTFDEIYRYISDKTEGIPYYARRLHGVEQDPTIEGANRGKVLVEYQ